MGNKKTFETLQSFNILGGLPEPKIRELSRVLVPVTAAAGTVIIEEGDPGDRMFLVAEGQVRIEKKAKEGMKELALLSTGDFFGEMALIEEAPRSARAVAETDVELLSLGRDELFKWLVTDSATAVKFLVDLLRGLSGRLRATSKELVLWHDLSHLSLGQFDDEASVLRATLRVMVPHLEGEWSAAAYLYDPARGLVLRVGTEGPKGEDQPDTFRFRGMMSGWMGVSSYGIVLLGKAGEPLGFVLLRNDAPMDQRLKDECESMFAAVGDFLTGALRRLEGEPVSKREAKETPYYG